MMFVPTWALLGGTIKLKAESNIAKATSLTMRSPFMHARLVLRDDKDASGLLTVMLVCLYTNHRCLG